jgi:hypothetical protein
LNGPYCGKVWILKGDTAHYGPFAVPNRSMTNRASRVDGH